ncbi:MAG: hypothetical protein QOI12_1250 [Alphaproteobacteria bacterium]|jgi:hypothetical protein|nr:hypothetical protein [Alphaproteobacteria bacterium]
MIRKIGNRFFVLRVVIGALAIFAGYNVLLAVVRPQATPSSDLGMRNRVVAERYFDGGVAPAVIVGSSVGFRLSPDFLQADALGPRIYDLALGGGSAASGLAIVLRKDDLPRTVVVETNFGYRADDPVLLRELVAEPRLTLRRHLPALRLENRPVDLLITSAWSWLRTTIVRPPGAATPAPGAPDEPAIAGFADRLAVTLSQNISVPAPLRAEIETGFDQLGERVDALRVRNVRVILMQFPMHPTIAASTLQQYSLGQAQKRFPPERYEWFPVADDASYRTDDGLHLTRPSGHRLATALRRFVEDAQAR